MRCVLIKADGQIKAKNINPGNFQEIEDLLECNMLSMIRFRDTCVGNMTVFIDDTSALTNKPHNAVATKLYDKSDVYGDVLVYNECYGMDGPEAGDLSNAQVIWLMLQQ